MGSRLGTRLGSTPQLGGGRGEGGGGRGEGGGGRGEGGGGRGEGGVVPNRERRLGVLFRGVREMGTFFPSPNPLSQGSGKLRSSQPPLP